MVRAERVRKRNNISNTGAGGPVVYWMSRDQRVRDNWALLYAAERAEELQQQLVVVFCLRRKFAHATSRTVDFMLSGLAEVEEDLKKKGAEFYFLLGDPGSEIPAFIKKHRASVLVSDFSPLRHVQKWQREMGEQVRVPFFEVDAHNIVPVWTASQKQEFGAYTLRPKLHRLLPEYVEEFPKFRLSVRSLSPATDWDKVRGAIEIDASVGKVDWILPGERAAEVVLQEFLQKKLSRYTEDRNDPTLDGQSNLSPYLHFGQLSAQRVVLSVLASAQIDISDVLDKKKNGASGKRGSVSAFIEELVVRRELSDNFCFYNSQYDSVKGFPGWAKKTLEEHRMDERPYVYTLSQLEAGKTHDELWNAAQLEMTKRGKMHGYMRMYWAKKIFEWSKTAEQALKRAIYLNDKYFLDGRDPNGYVGIAWSMGGVHDRAWFERPIFGKIRYMSYGGAKGKFSIAEYIRKVKALS